MLTSDTIESRYRQLYHQASSSSSKKLTPAQEELRKSLVRARAGWQALCAWIEMPETELGDPDSRALADAGLSMIEDAEVRGVALLDIARTSLRQDKLIGWSFCVEKGFDPIAPDLVGAGRDGIWSRVGRDSSSWLSRAISTESWNCAAMFARSPLGKVGLPGIEPESSLGKDGEGSGASHAKSKNKQKTKREELMEKARRADPKIDLIILQSEGGWHLSNHPSLIEWERELRGEKKFPAAFRKALKDNGFEPAWGTPGFDFAAASLALRGSTLALAGCVANSVSCEKALASMDSDGLDLRSGLLGEKGKASSWAAAKEWIDSQMGAGHSDKLIEDRAFAIVMRMADRFGVNEKDVAKAIEWLGANGCKRLDMREDRIVKLQGLALELAESDKGKPEAKSSKIKELIGQWEGYGHEPPKPRRLLKA